MEKVNLRNLKLILVLFIIISSIISYYQFSPYFVTFKLKFHFRTVIDRLAKDYSNSKDLSASYNYSSTCGDQRGPGQWVISYSLFSSGKTFNSYKKGVQKNLDDLKNVYNKNSNRSNWIMRVYSNLNMTEELHRLRNNNPSLDWCDMPELFPDVYLKVNPRSWRFFALADPLVDILISRDIDGELMEREKSAVDEWLRSNFTFHLMRDHPNHTAKILAGMWGVKLNQIKPIELVKIQENCILSGQMNDQAFLAKYIWDPYMKKNAILSHDSYHCLKFSNNSSPWPTRRIGRDFVGQQVSRRGHYGIKNSTECYCPVKCRPKFGQDWIFC